MITKGQILEPEPIQLKIPQFSGEVELNPKLAKKMYPIEQHLTETERAKQWVDKNHTDFTLTKAGMGFRHLHQLQALLRASALRRGDTKVTELDVKLLLELGHWINYDFNVL